MSDQEVIDMAHGYVGWSAGFRGLDHRSTAAGGLRGLPPTTTSVAPAITITPVAVSPATVVVLG